MEMIEDIKRGIQEAQEEMDALTIDPDDCEDIYCEALDCEGPVYAGSIAFDPSHILRELDPTAYRCGLVDYVDGIDVADTAEYQELAEEIEELKAELEKREDEP